MTVCVWCRVPGAGARRRDAGEKVMCRAIKSLANFEPPATDEEIRASALQFVRKLSGTRGPRGRMKRCSTWRWRT